MVKICKLRGIGGRFQGILLMGAISVSGKLQNFFFGTQNLRISRSQNVKSPDIFEDPKHIKSSGSTIINFSKSPNEIVRQGDGLFPK